MHYITWLPLQSRKEITSKLKNMQIIIEPNPVGWYFFTHLQRNPRNPIEWTFCLILIPNCKFQVSAQKQKAFHKNFRKLASCERCYFVLFPTAIMLSLCVLFFSHCEFVTLKNLAHALLSANLMWFFVCLFYHILQPSSLKTVRYLYILNSYCG